MTRTISFITATVGAALLFAVPAYGDNWGADRAQVVDQVRVSPDLADRAIAAEQIRIERMLDARERALGVSVQQSRNSRPEPVRDDRFRLTPDTTTPSVTASSSGNEIELPQIGIGLGIGLVLALGLYLAMRYSRGRQLAH